MTAALSRMHDPRERPFVEITSVALAISSRPHVGILYRDDAAAPGGAMMIHLAWHHDLRSEEARASYHWIEPDLEPERKRPLARLCKLLARKYVGGARRIKYALRYADGTFDPTSGEFLTGQG